MGLLDGRAVIVTGSARGIGRATAELFAAEGAEAAHGKNTAVGRSSIATRGARNRKENNAAWVEAIAAVVLRDNENLPAAGSGLAFEQLQTVRYKTVKIGGEQQKKVSYASPEVCRKCLWGRLAEAAPQIRRAGRQWGPPLFRRAGRPRSNGAGRAVARLPAQFAVTVQLPSAHASPPLAFTCQNAPRP